jgi:cell division protein FtsQ
MATVVFNPRTSAPPELPADVRLMNTVSRLLWAVVAMGAFALAVAWAIRQPVFTLRSIQLEGDVARSSLATIRANATPKLAGNFFTMELADAQRAFQSVPWVRQAVVQRVWPNRLSVRLEEHRAAALWSQEGSSEEASDRIVNTFGEVFEANLGDVEDDQLPKLTGPDGSSAEMLALLRRLVPVLAPLDAQVETLSLSGRGSWHVELSDGAEIEMGRGTPDEVLARTERFVGTLDQVMSRFQRPLQYADLRHNGGYAVRLKGITTTLTTDTKTLRN